MKLHQIIRALVLAIGFIAPVSTVYSQVLITQPSAVETYTVRKEAVTDPATVAGLTNAEKTRTISYVDGFSRPIQSIVVAGSPNGKDIIGFNVYDAYGRVPKQYLPYEATTSSGAYVSMSSIVGLQASFYSPSTSASKKIAGDNSPFSEQTFENSPLQRALNIGGVGDVMQLSQNHYKEISYRTGLSSDQVRKWTLNSTYANSSATYDNNELSVTRVVDKANANGSGTYADVYKDKFGRVILKRQEATSGTYDTYYVYDIAGNVVYIIPPRAIQLMGPGAMGYYTYNTPELIYQFWYDSKNRVVKKKVPGSGVTSIVYDPLDRVVLTQQANMYSAKNWNYVKYDNANRVVVQGIYTHTGSEITQEDMQAYVSNSAVVPCYSNGNYFEVRQATSSGYSNQCFPTNGTEERMYNYYDDYDFDFNGSPDYSKQDQGLTGEATATSLTHGLATGSKRKILGTSTWLINVVFYDKYYNAIQVRSNNQIKTGVTDHTTSVVNFVGQALETKQVKTIGDPNGITNTLEIVVSNRYEYDDMGRLTKVKQTNPNQSEVTVAKYEYNPLGQLVDKKLHSTNNGASYLQSVDMRYNIRGQLTSINNSTLTPDGVTNDESNDVFGMELLYDKVESGSGTINNTANYTGMISAVKWKVKSGTSANDDERSFLYTYDKLYRITGTAYKAKASGGSLFNKQVDGFNENFTYDENGNIKTLDRWAWFNLAGSRTKIDELVYSYTNSDKSNQLEYVSDAINTNAAGYGFRNYTNSGSTSPYSYDANGNLTGDLKKGTTITYNELNKPTLIQISSTKKVELRYDAAGNRVSKYVYNNSSTVTKRFEYIGGYVIENDILSYYSMAEGRVRNEGAGYGLSMKMEYFITDHQGNVRVSFEDNGSGTALLKQENSYYAFGMQMAGAYLPTNANKKLYNAGSEWQDDIDGLAEYYSTFFREYDPVIGRFNSVDPLAEMTNDISTYGYANNNPIMMNDPMGLVAGGGGGRPPKGWHDGGYGWLPNIGDDLTDELFEPIHYYRPQRGISDWLIWQNRMMGLGVESEGVGGIQNETSNRRWVPEVDTRIERNTQPPLGGKLYETMDAAAIAWAVTGGALNTKENWLEYSSVIFVIKKNGKPYYGYTPPETFEDISREYASQTSPGPNDPRTLKWIKELPTGAEVVAVIHSHTNQGSDPNNFSKTTRNQRGDEYLYNVEAPWLKYYLVTPNGNMFELSQGPKLPKLTGLPYNPTRMHSHIEPTTTYESLGWWLRYNKGISLHLTEQEKIEMMRKPQSGFRRNKLN